MATQTQYSTKTQDARAENPAVNGGVDYQSQARVLVEKHMTGRGIYLSLSVQPQRFLEAVYGALLDRPNELAGVAVEGEYLDRYSDPEHPTWQPVLRPAWAWVDQPESWVTPLQYAAQENARTGWHLAGRGGVYWHGATRLPSVAARGKSARGSRTELGSVGAFWCDIDCAKQGYPLATALDALLSMPLKPSIVVFSGGGLQAVHLLNEAWLLGTPESAEEYKAQSLALYREYLEGLGVLIDPAVHDAARMMRLPGFINRKPSRNGATAEVVYWSPDTRYTLAQIQAAAPLPVQAVPLIDWDTATGQTGQGSAPVSPADGVYAVRRNFVWALVQGVGPDEGTRHTTALSLALQAARSGMARVDFEPRFLQKVAGWAGEQMPARELQDIISWAYARASTPHDARYPADHRVTLTETGFAEHVDAPEMGKDERPVPLPPEDVPNQEIAPKLWTVEALRADQAREIDMYLDAPNPHGLGTAMLIQTPPGAGKTHAVWAALVARAQAAAAGGPAFKAVFAGLFREEDWGAYLDGYGVPRHLVYYFEERNDKQGSAGYCALSKQAETVAARNHPVQKVLCTRCPHHDQCKRAWYLSQFTRAEQAAITMVRHPHVHMGELLQGADVVAIDESPEQVVATAVKVEAAQMVLPSVSQFVEDNCPAELLTLRKWLTALAGVVATATPADRWRGRVLFDKLATVIGERALDDLAALELKTVRLLCGEVDLSGISQEDVNRLPLNYILDLWQVWVYEHRTHYAEGQQDGKEGGNSKTRKPAWNSRIVVSKHALAFYPMEPLTFTQKTKVLVTDATGLPELYPLMLGDKSVPPRPRLIHVYSRPLERRAEIVQMTGGTYSRTTMRRAEPAPRKKARSTYLYGTELVLEDESSNAAWERVKDVIGLLAERHGEMLVVSYKDEVLGLRRWPALGLPQDYVQWFGNLRGKNHYKELPAVLIAGTPRKADDVMLASAEAWFWREDVPISPARKWRLKPYPGYKQAYRYLGFADDRVDRLFTGWIDAELWQCAERVRLQTSKDARALYILTEWPFTDYLSDLVPIAAWLREADIQKWVEGEQAAGRPIRREAFVKYLGTLGVTKSTAYRDWERIAPTLRQQAEDEWLLMGDKARVVRNWLEADKARAALTNREVVARMAAEGLAVSLGTVARVRRAMSTEGALEGANLLNGLLA